MTSFLKFLTKDKIFFSQIKKSITAIPYCFIPYAIYWIVIILTGDKYQQGYGKALLILGFLIYIYFFVRLLIFWYRKYLSHKKWYK